MTTKQPKTSLSEHLDDMEDPRRDHGKKYPLKTIVILAVMAAIAGADDWVAVERYCRMKWAWLSTIMDLPHGIPSHDTFRRVFILIAPEAFQRCFLNWVQSLVAQSVIQLRPGEVIALDGKTSRRTHDHTQEREALQMVTAWASDAGIVLAQRNVLRDAVDGTNEIATVPEVLQSLVLKGCIVTVDAANCQTGNARIIVERGGDYVFALKENHPKLHEEVRQLVEDAQRSHFKSIQHETWTTRSKAHGRIETRRHLLITDPHEIDYVNRAGRWWGLGAIGVVERTRQIGETLEHKLHFFVTSLKGDVKQFARAVRRHWGIENSLHWVLDIAFNEDQSRARTGAEPENIAVLRHLALNLLKLDTSVKDSIKGKRQRAGWDDTYMLAILAAGAASN